MATCTLGQILDDVRAYLTDTQVTGGEIFTNSVILGTAGTSGSLFGEPYRTMFSKLTGASKRVQTSIHIVLPANTTVVIPSTYNITDFSEPEMIEERTAGSSIAIASTDTGTPITVTTSAAHGLTGTVEGAISGVPGTAAPWGNWFVTVTGTTTFTLNGSASDGVAGTSGGFFYPAVSQVFTEVFPVDLVASLDGQPAGFLGNYLFQDNRLIFRGATNAVEMRISYYMSGTAPTNPNLVIPIDGCRDFLATATASNCARSKGWMPMYKELREKAYGDPAHPEELALIDLFYMSQVMADQRGPSRRQLAFRDRKYKFGSYIGAG